MHLTVCAVGTVLAMAGHFPYRPRLWVPHLVGIALMVQIALGRGGETMRWGGVVTLALLAVYAVAGLNGARERIEAGLDAAAMTAFIVIMPVGHHAHAGTGPAAIAVATLLAWAAGRLAAARTLTPPCAGAASTRAGKAHAAVVHAGEARAAVASAGEARPEEAHVGEAPAGEGHGAVWARVNLLGSAAMFAGMALMLV